MGIAAGLAIGAVGASAGWDRPGPRHRDLYDSRRINRRDPGSRIPDRIQPLAGTARLRVWLVRNNATVMSILLLVIGVVIIGKGIADF